MGCVRGGGDGRRHAVAGAQIYERQAWVRQLVSAHHYSSYFQDHLGEVGVFVYDKVEGEPRAMLHLWAHSAKQQFPVVDGAISQQEAVTDTMRAWLTLCWMAAAGEAGKDAQSNTTRNSQRDQTDER
jgi:hypothetical protein